MEVQPNPNVMIPVMPKTLIIQSSRAPLPYTWVDRCLASVRDWCELNQFDYQFLGDELFDGVPADLMEKTKEKRVVATDLARLMVLKQALVKGCETVVWLDADFLIFNPEHFVLPKEPYAVGREVWVQFDKKGKLRVYNKVHNAFLMFKKGNSFLDYYADTAERLLQQNQGYMPPQYIGPKLLSALHNISSLPVMETAGMLSPLVIKDILQGGGEALEMFTDQSTHPIAGANLCTSCCNNGEVSIGEIEQLIEALQENGI